MGKTTNYKGYNISGFVGSGYINEKSVYLYYEQDNEGAYVQENVPVEGTQLFYELEEGEQPYIKKIYTVRVTTDANITPEARVTEEVIGVRYQFYLPKDAYVQEFNFN